MRLKVEMGQGRAKGQSLKTEDGELIEGVKSIEWHAEAVERPLVTVQLYAEKVDFDLGSSDEDAAPAPAPEPES